MQIATSLFYDSAAKRMSSLTSRANALQTQIATGKRIQSPSEDAALAQQTAEFDRKDADTAMYQTNLKLAGSLLDQADGVLTNINTQLQRAKELTTQAANGTQTAESRMLIGVELTAIVDSLVSLANTRNLRGQPLFGTEDGTMAVTKTGDTSFSFASTKVSDIPIGDGMSMSATESAGKIFADDGNGNSNLRMLAELAKSLSDGNAPGATSLDDITKMSDTVSFVQASVGARGARVELQQNILQKASDDRAALRSSVEDVDITSAVTEMQKIMTTLSATQASFTKLASLSLFDYLR